MSEGASGSLISKGKKDGKVFKSFIKLIKVMTVQCADSLVCHVEEGQVCAEWRN